MSGRRHGVDYLLTCGEALDAHGSTATLFTLAGQLWDLVLDLMHASVDVTAGELEQTWRRRRGWSWQWW